MYKVQVKNPITIPPETTQTITAYTDVTSTIDTTGVINPASYFLFLIILIDSLTINSYDVRSRMSNAKLIQLLQQKHRTDPQTVSQLGPKA